MKSPWWLLLLAALLAAAGCMSPRYQTLYRYEPPTDVAGKVCLEQCEQKIAGCKNHCEEKYGACVKSVEPMIEQHYEESMRRYQRELNYYYHAVEIYQRQITLGWYYYDPYYGSWPYFYGYEPRFPPIPPFQPNRERIARQVIQQQCDRDCGCQSVYDACFLGCGGIKIPEVKCVANCP
jgi:hypothetical protein